MPVTLSDEQAKNWAASLRNMANQLDPPVTTPSTPTTPPPPASTVPVLDPRFTQVAFTDFRVFHFRPTSTPISTARATKEKAGATRAPPKSRTAIW
jgi:hypothetical protein